jgi:transposase
MAGRRLGALALADAERSELTALASRPKTALARRARVILACAGGHENKTVSSERGVHAMAVGKWRRRFLSQRVDGLRDEPRPGAPRTVGDARIEAVTTRALESQPEDATHWSSRGMARDSGLSVSTVQRIWRAFGLKPHRRETFKLSTGPDFVAKARDVVAATGQVIGKRCPRHRAVEFRRCLDEIGAAVPGGLEAHLIWDNHATHKTATIRTWLAKRPRWHVHLTPTSSSWLNQAERFFALLTEQRIRRGVHRSVAELEAATNAFLDRHNAGPKPFRWVKSADDILAAIERFCTCNTPST